ncbi:glycosyltransferase [Pseudomonadota bacterium]
MKIYYLINGFNGGGAALPVPELISVMRSCGHTVKVYGLMLQDGKACANFERAGVEYEVLGRGKWDIAASWMKLLNSLKRDAPDLIWTSLTRATLFGQLAGKKLSIPVVSWQHSAFLKSSNLFLLRRTRHLTHRWLADSENVRAYVVNQMGVNPERVSIWPMFQVQADASKSLPWPGHGPVRIGSLGRLHVNKRYDSLVRAAALVQQKHPDLAGRIEFVVGGVGPELYGLESLLDKLGVKNFKFVGFVDEPAEFLKGLHIYIQTSHHEGLCIAAHEAMRSALPVIATRVGQLRHSIIDGKTGILCDVGDDNALADAIVSLVREPGRAHVMGTAALERVTSLFSPDVFRRSGESFLRMLEAELLRPD